MNGRLLGLIVFVLVVSWPAAAADCPRGNLTGQVTHVRDGDTIVVGSMPIRLNGLAAPEGDEPGGTAATQAVLELVQGRTLRCELDGARTHDRCVGVCYLDGVDVSEIMLQRGLARDWPRFSGGRHAEAERELPPMARRSARFVPCRILPAAPMQLPGSPTTDVFGIIIGVSASHRALESRHHSSSSGGGSKADPAHSATRSWRVSSGTHPSAL